MASSQILAQWNPVKLTTDASSWGWNDHLEDLQVSWLKQRTLGSRTGPEGRIQGQEVQVCVFGQRNNYLLPKLSGGGTRSRSLLKLSLKVLVWAKGVLPSISAVYIKGTTKIEADFPSRQPIHQGGMGVEPRNLFSDNSALWGNGYRPFCLQWEQESGTVSLSPENGDRRG